jgi:hypothetical protein
MRFLVLFCIPQARRICGWLGSRQVSQPSRGERRPLADVSDFITNVVRPRAPSGATLLGSHVDFSLLGAQWLLGSTCYHTGAPNLQPTCPGPAARRVGSRRGQYRVWNFCHFCDNVRHYGEAADPVFRLMVGRFGALPSVRWDPKTIGIGGVASDFLEALTRRNGGQESVGRMSCVMCS